MRKLHRYTKEQINYIGEIAKGRSVKEINELVNARFNINVTHRSIGGIMYRNGIKNKMEGHSTRFEKGRKAWNKGMKGLDTGGVGGRFKKGNPIRRLPIGSENIKDDIVFIKVAQPKDWQPKHRYIWEQAYGSIPEGNVIRFKDGNSNNVVLDNLMMVSRSAASSVIKGNRGYEDSQLNYLVHNLAELEFMARDRSSS